MYNESTFKLFSSNSPNLNRQIDYETSPQMIEVLNNINYLKNTISQNQENKCIVTSVKKPTFKINMLVIAVCLFLLLFSILFVYKRECKINPSVKQIINLNNSTSSKNDKGFMDDDF